MKRLAIGIGIVLVMAAYSFPTYAGYQRLETMFSVEGIYQSLKENYAFSPCKHYNFRSTAKTVYDYLKSSGEGASYTPFNCNGLTVEFENNGSDVLSVHVRGEILDSMNKK